MSTNLKSDNIRIAVTGTAWMGGGVGSVQSAIEELFQKAENEIQIAIYEITDGANEFLETLRRCLARGIKIVFLINRFDKRPSEVRKRLTTMAKRFPHLTLLDFRSANDFEDLHAKMIVVDRREALIGSANLTWKGLVGNHEIAVVVSGPTAYLVAKLFDSLCEDTRVTKVGI